MLLSFDRIRLKMRDRPGQHSHSLRDSRIKLFIQLVDWWLVAEILHVFFTFLNLENYRDVDSNHDIVNGRTVSNRNVKYHILLCDQELNSGLKVKFKILPKAGTSASPACRLPKSSHAWKQQRNILQEWWSTICNLISMACTSSELIHLEYNFRKPGRDEENHKLTEIASSAVRHSTAANLV